MESETPETPVDPESTWPEISADLRSARTAARAVTLDTHRAATDSRVEEIKLQFDQLHQRMVSVEKDMSNARIADHAVADMSNRFVETQKQLGETNVRFDELAQRVVASERSDTSDLTTSVAHIDARITASERAQLNQKNEFQELMTYVERAFLRIDEVEERLRNHTATTASADQSELARELEAFDEAVIGIRDHIEERTAQLNNRLDQQAIALESTKADLGGRLKVSEQRLLEVIEQTSALRKEIDDSKVGSSSDATRAELDSIRNELDTVAASAKGATELAEGLRDIQAEVVQAVRSELSTYDTRLDALSRTPDRDSQSAGIVTEQTNERLAEQVSELEARYLSTRTDLTDLGKRVVAIQAQAAPTVVETDSTDQEARQRLDSIEAQLEQVAGQLQGVQAQTAATTADIAQFTSSDPTFQQDSRVDELEKKLEEALSTIEALAEVQLKTAQVDQRIADSLEELKSRVGMVSAKQDAMLGTTSAPAASTIADLEVSEPQISEDPVAEEPSTSGDTSFVEDLSSSSNKTEADDLDPWRDAGPQAGPLSQASETLDGLVSDETKLSTTGSVQAGDTGPDEDPPDQPSRSDGPDQAPDDPAGSGRSFLSIDPKKKSRSFFRR